MAPSASQHCLSGSLAQLGEGAACTAPPTTALFTALLAKEATEQGRIAALHPLVTLLFFSSMKPAQNFMRPTFCSRDACSLQCYLPGASSCNPLISPRLQSCALQMPRAALLPSKPPCMQCSRTKLSEKDQGSSQKFAVPSLGLEPPFSCFGDKFQSVPAKERHCFAPRHYNGKWSAQCHDLAVTFLSLPSCNGVGEKNPC